MSLEKKRQQAKQLSEIQALLKQKISLSQEILSQLSQQEYLLLIGELKMREKQRRELQPLLKQLKAMQKEYGMLTQILISKENVLSLADLLDPTDETDAETLILIEKYETLKYKIIDQEKRNQSLFEIVEHEGKLDPFNEALKAQTICSSKSQKPLLITIDYPQERTGS